MIGLELALDDLGQTILELERIFDAPVEDQDQLLDDLAGDIVNMVDLAFREETSPDGEAWAGLTDLTLSRRREGGAHILRDRGDLAASFLPQPAAGGEVMVGSVDEKAPTHQYGAKQGQYGSWRNHPIPWGDIPARPMLPDQNGDALRELIEERVETWFSSR